MSVEHDAGSRGPGREKPKVLCVDDEPRVLEGLGVILRREYEVSAATSGLAAIQLLRTFGPFAVVLSDMRMPGIDGAALLAGARDLQPDATRMLLTGQADLQAAIDAVNFGQIFRFLTKPCPPEQLRAAFAAAVEQHRLVTSERVLLQQTLLGTVEVLAEILSLTAPAAFGRATRVRKLVVALAPELGITDVWALTTAALLGPLGAIVLSDEVATRLSRGETLSNDERVEVERLPELTRDMLAHIPRLEPVIAILSASEGKPVVSPSANTAGAALRIAADFDELESRGLAVEAALATLRGRAGRYPSGVLEAFLRTHGVARVGQVVREVSLAQLAEGMTLVDDARLESGVLLAARGHVVTRAFVARARNFPRGSVREPLCVYPATTT